MANRYLIFQFNLAHYSHHLSTTILVPLLPLLREDFGLDYLHSGMLVSAFSLSMGLGQIPMAVLSDRIGRRPLIIGGLLGVAAASIMVSLTWTFLQMMACFVAMGLLAATYHASASSFISQALPREVRGRALGMHVIGGSAGFLTTPILAVAIAGLTHSWRTAFFLLAIPALFASVLIFFGTEEPVGDTERRAKTAEGGQGVDQAAKPSRLPAGKPSRLPAGKHPVSDMEEGRLSWMDIVKAIGLLASLAMILTMISGSVNSFLPLYMVDHHHIAPNLAGIVGSIIAGAGMIGAPLGGALSDRIGRKSIILASFCVSGPLLLGVTLSPFGMLLLVSLIAYGMTMVVRMPIMESLIADVVPARRRATVLGVYFFLCQETSGALTPFLGYLNDIFGVDSIFLIIAVGLSVAGVVAFLGRKKL